MATLLGNFVCETANNPGTGIVTLNGAVTERRTFSSAFPQGGTVYYFIDDGAQAEWGTGKLDVSGPVTLTRSTVKGTTAGGTAPLNFTGAVRVYSDLPADCIPLIGEDGLTRVGSKILADRDWLAQNYPNRTEIESTYSPLGWFPAGAIVDYAGSAPPAGWLLCYGQSLSRTTYATLFAAIGTTFGAGDGSTTFALPDLRGRATFGVDNMGIVPANRVTAGGSGIDGGQIGAAGGNELAQEHAHDIEDKGHEHELTDPGHSHAPKNGGGFAVTQGSQGDGQAAFASGKDNWVPGTSSTSTETTGMELASATTGIKISSAGNGASQNMPPAMMMNKIIYTGADAQA